MLPTAPLKVVVPPVVTVNAEVPFTVALNVIAAFPVLVNVVADLIRRLNGAFAPTPYSPTLEKQVLPQVEDIVLKIRGLIAE